MLELKELEIDMMKKELAERYSEATERANSLLKIIDDLTIIQ